MKQVKRSDMKKQYTEPRQRVIRIDTQLTLMQTSETYNLDRNKTIAPEDGQINSLSRDNATGSWDDEW